MKNRFLDFDRYLQEKDDKTVCVRVYGEDVTVKAEIPMLVPMMLSRSLGGGSDVLSDQEAGLLVFRAADQMFGKEQVDRLCAHGMSTDDMKELMSRVFAMVSGSDEAEDEGETFDDDTGKRTVKRTSPNGSVSS